MKVLVIHNCHRKGSASGDDQVYKDETRLMECNGIDVVRYAVHNDSFDKKNIFGKILNTFGMLWSFKNYRNVSRIIKDEAPSIVHVHTFFPLLSPSILYAAKRNNCKVIATLHDTRFICPCATSLRKGNICNKCGDGHYLRMVKYGCFKNSRIQSMIVALIFKYHHVRRTFYKQIDKYICLNDCQVNLLKEIGFEEQKIVKKPNFVRDYVKDNIDISQYRLPDKFVVYYGRLGEEKGIKVLEQIWERINEIPLVVMGAGPLEEEFCKWSKDHKNVIYLGYIKHNVCMEIVKKCEFVIFPSIWYEGCSMVEIETESLGKGLVATDLGFSSEAIKNGVNGYKVELNNIDDFVQTIINLWSNPRLIRKIGDSARKDYETKYCPENNIEMIKRIYSSLVN